MEIKVVVCGDSYCSADNTRERWHFSQILNDRYDMTVTNLARGGISNLGICFQIKQAIELEPHVIIYNQTDPARVDIVMKSLYGKQVSLKEFIYPYTDDSSFYSPYVGHHTASIFSTMPHSLDKIKQIYVDPEKVTAVKYYHAHLFDWQLRKETDSWWFAHWHHQIEQAQILAIDLTSPNHTHGQSPIGKIMYDFVKHNPGWPKLYHTDRSTQELVADQLHEQIKNFWDKK